MPAWNSGTEPVKDRLAVEPSVAEAIARYRPYKTTAADWDRIGDFVRACASDLTPPDVHRAREWVRTLIPFVLWCSRDGFPLDRERLFTRDNIDRYIENGAASYTVQSRATRRSALRRMARELTQTAPWPPLPELLPAQPRHAPYTTEDVEGFWGLQQRTALLQRRLRATLCLGLGAGLWAREYYTCTTKDLAMEDGVTWLQVHGDRARRLPIRHRYAAELHRIASGDPGSTFFGGHLPTADRSRLWHLLRDIEVPRWLPRLETERLRSTWLVHHMSQRVPLPELLQAAGLKSTRSITLLLPFVPPAEDRLSVRLLADQHE